MTEQPLLSQMIAVRKGLRGRTDAEITQHYHDLQRIALFAGLTRTYAPKDEDGDKMPSEYTKVQKSVPEVLADIAMASTKMLDVLYTVDEGNTNARGNVVVDGRTLFSAPTPFLLALQKELTHFRTIVSKVPTLDPATRWETDETGEATYRSAPEQTNRTQKVLKNHVKAKATDKHPEQVETFTVDEVKGTWTLTKFSSAMTAKDRDALLQRVNELLDAVRKAVEEANATRVEQKQIGETIYAHLLG